MKQLVNAKQKLAELATQMRAITDAAVQDDRGLSVDERQNWNNLNDAYEAQEGLITALERQASGIDQIDDLIDEGQIEQRHADEFRQADVSGREKRAGEQKIKSYDEAFDRYMRTTERRNLMKPSDHEVLNEGYTVFDEETRTAQTTQTDATGGYTIPEGFRTDIRIAMLQYGGIEAGMSQVITTDSGNTIPWPTINDTSNKGAIIAENTADSPNHLVFGSVSLVAYTFTSRLVLVPWELLQDNAVNLQGLMARWLGERLGRITSQYYATGTGSSQPQGITNCTLGTTTANSTGASVTYNKLLDLKHSVDPAYRMGAKWCFHDTTLKTLKQLLDGDSRPLWQPEISQNIPATIDGDPFVIDQEMPKEGDNDASSPDGGEKLIVYGDPSGFIIRNVRAIQMVTLRERYAEKRQNGYFAWCRADSKLVDPGSGLKHLALGTGPAA